jgi:hypothetical protein
VVFAMQCLSICLRIYPSLNLGGGGGGFYSYSGVESLSNTARCPVTMGILDPKMDAISIGPK